MNFDKVIGSGLLIVTLAAATGQLPRLMANLRVAQMQILVDAKSSKWGRPFLPSSGREAAGPSDRWKVHGVPGSDR